MRCTLPVRSVRLALIVSFVAGLAIPAANAETTAGSGLMFTLENDLFARGKTDRWYTNGVRIAWQQGKPDVADQVIAQKLFGIAGLGVSNAVLDPDQRAKNIIWSLGQIMYTPRNIQRATPQRGDRPWAGWLYLGATAQGFKGDRFQQTDLKIGCTGSCSGADAVQRWVHKGVDAPYPAGWELQLKTRAEVQASHLRLWRRGDDDGKRNSGDWLGLHGGFGATVGTLRNYASVMAGVVAGDLRGANPVFALSNDGDLVIQDFGNRRALSQLLFFANVSGTAVANNRFITGPTPYGRSEIELRRWVTAWQWGVSIPLDRWFDGKRIVFSQTARTSEFNSPLFGRKEGVQRWGSLTFASTL